MTPCYSNVDGDAPYKHGTFDDETSSLFLLDSGAGQLARRVIFESEEDSIARNREIARLLFSWVA